MDLSYYSLKALSWVGLVSKLRTPSEQVKNVYLKYTPEERAALNRSLFVSLFDWSAPLTARRKAAEQTMRAAEEKVREALAAAADSLRAQAHDLSVLVSRFLLPEREALPAAA